MAITALPTPPSRADAANFADRGDAFLGALPAFQSEANALATDVNTKQGIASTAATTATTQAGIATTQAQLAADQVPLAAAQVVLAEAQVDLAETQVGLAEAQVALATTQAGNALTSANNAEASFDEFDERYLGAKTSDPTLDNDGNALVTGALYFNSVVGEMRVFSGLVFVAAFLPEASFVTLNGTQTLTNKTIDASTNTIIGVGDVTLTGTQTLTNKTIDIATNTLTGVQPTLVSGTSIKTLNGGSLLGSGDIAISGIAEIRTPVITSPANNATGVSIIPTIEGSVFAPAYSVDTRDFRQLQIDIAQGDFTSPVVDQQANTNNIAVSTPLAELTEFKARIRDVALTGVASLFSNLTNFTTAGLPDAPIIVTATAIGSSTVTVSFTAPANDGNSPITSYTATSTPDGITGTLNQAGSGTITVTGLTPNTAYTFTVTATNGIGVSAPSNASNSVTPILPAIGDAFEGGFFAGQISTPGNSVATHNLIVGPKSSAEFFGRWKTSNTSTANTTHPFNGAANTDAMIAAGAADHPCGNFCNNLVAGGFSDWYMPAKNELEILYFNLKPTTQSNNANSGANSNAVPSRPSNYTSGNPAQTSAAAFQTGGAEVWSSSYWNSTQITASNAQYQSFANGYQRNTLFKSNSSRVRAIRKVPV